MPEQRKRLHCVAELTLSTTFLLASEVPAIAAFARSGLHQERDSKTRERGTESRLSPSLTFFEVALFDVVFGCRPDQGRNTCRNSANASIVSKRLRYQRRFYLRPKFRQL